MKPPPLIYQRADSVEGALHVLHELGDSAKVLAGGQSLVPLLNLRLARPEVVLDISRLSELGSIRPGRDGLTIGALTSQRDAEASDDVSAACPLMTQALHHVAHPAIRNRGTVGGSIAHGDPAAELPLVACAVRGSMTVRSLRGERTVAAEDFFQGFLQTAVEPDELLTSISLPPPAPDAGYAFEEFARRPGDFAIVAVAAEVRRQEGTVQGARLAIGGVGSSPVVLDLNGELAGASADEAAVHCAGAAAGGLQPAGDVHGSAEYRRALTHELVKRAVFRAAQSEEV